MRKGVLIAVRLRLHLWFLVDAVIGARDVVATEAFAVGLWRADSVQNSLGNAEGKLWGAKVPNGVVL